MYTNHNREVYTPLLSLKFLIPQLQIDKWQESGIHWVEDLLQDHKFLARIDLISIFNIPHSDFFLHLPISQFLKIHLKACRFFTDPHPTVTGISLFYSLLQCRETFHKPPNGKMGNKFAIHVLRLHLVLCKPLGTLSKDYL